MKVNKEVNRIRKEMENENYETLFKNVAGVVQERAEAAGRDLELCHKRTVIHSISARMKSPDSIYKKLVKKGLNPTIAAARQELADLFGVRIVVMYLDDIYQTAGLLKQSAGMTLLYEKDYIRNPKRSGYRGLHLIFGVDVFHHGKVRREKCEVQIRTMAMNFWATIEHSLQYKYKGDMPPHVAERLSKASDAIISLDHEMSSVRNEIMDAQNSSQMQSNLVKDILNNIENLYRVSSEREVSKIQDEFLRVFKTKDLRQLERFHRQLDIIAEGYRAQAVHHSI